MYTLALDTTSPVGGLAVMRDHEVVTTLNGDSSRTHGERLPGDVLRVLETAGLALGDVDLYAVARGPGGFTGLRVGISTTQGLALVHGRPVAAISALEAAARAALMAEAGIGRNDLVGVWLDAHRGEVFSALYGMDESPADPSSLRIVDEPRVDTPAAVLVRWRTEIDAGRIWLTGAGALRYRAEARDGGLADEIRIGANLAVAVGVIAVESARLGTTLSPHEVAPLYIRRPDAELARQRRVGRR